MRDLGPVPAGKVYAELMRHREPLPYLGDLMVWWLLRPLLEAERPLLEVVSNAGAEWPHRQVQITAMGREVLDGQRNWLDLGPPVRWVGGVEVGGHGRRWCFDDRQDRVV